MPYWLASSGWEADVTKPSPYFDAIFAFREEVFGFTLGEGCATAGADAGASTGAASGLSQLTSPVV